MARAFVDGAEAERRGHFALLLSRIGVAQGNYPRQFWLLFWGRLINAAGGSIVWPFMTIYMRERMQLSLSAVGLLFALNALAGLATGAFAGPVVDRVGRKGAMVTSLALNGLCLMLMGQARSAGAFALLMVCSGIVNPLYSVGADAMVADLVPQRERAGGYALLRMIGNLGVAIGPAVGGFITAVSYSLAFGLAAASATLFGVLILFLAVETRPVVARAEGAEADGAVVDGGYGPVLRDRRFLAFVAAYAGATVVAAMMMVLLPVYAKENFRVPESSYGFIMATNALMVVLFQYSVTRAASRHAPFHVLALGSLFYAVGAGSVAWGHGFPAFVASMAIYTVGEMLLVPTSTALAANMAPIDMRGRYMSVVGLAWGFGLGVGPALGGYLNDQVAPVAIWYSTFLIGGAAALAFWLMARRVQVREAA